MNSEFYNLKATSLQGKEVSMETFKGKTILVVNTASKCGLTPQYEGLEKLYKEHKDKGLVILGFPCNQFLKQEPGDEKSISEGCLVNYGVSFPMFSKIDVNGKNTHPIFQHLKNELGGTFGKSVKWNFTKFLINSDGEAVKRYSPTTKPEKIEKDILEVIENKKIKGENFIQHKSSIGQQVFRFLLGFFMTYAGFSHLTFARTEFVAQVPTWLPLNADFVVLASGVVELVLGLSMLFFRSRRIQVGLALAIFYILIFPGNISQYVNDVNAFGLDTEQKRLIRLFFQPGLVFLALWATGAIEFWKKKGLKAFFKK